MRIGLGADHRGFRLKERLKVWLRRQGHEVVDKGTFSEERTDYPDYARAVADAVAQGRVQRGILVCATGIGMSIAANRLRGIRAALCTSARMARMSRAHNNSNVLCLGADLVSRRNAERIVATWLETDFERGRHRARLAKLERG